MSLPKFSVNQSLFVNLVSIILVIVGLMVVFSLNREVFPNVNFDIVSISAVYPGATPSDVEKSITVPIEKELREVDGVKEINSASAVGVAAIYAEIDPDEKDKPKVVRDLQSALDRVKDLPRDVDDPILTEISNKTYPIIEVSLSGDMSEKKLRYYADALADDIEDIKGVARITKDGYRDREMQILLDPDKAREYYVSIDEIEQALASRNISMPAGKIDTETTEFSVRTTGEFLTAEEVGDVIIRANDSGNWLKIKDIAKVKDGFKREDIITKTWGTRSINLIVLKKESGDAIGIVRELKEVGNKLLEKIPDDLTISYVNDYSFFVKRRLKVLSSNAIFGIILVIATMLAFLEKRVAMVTVLGLPIAFLTTFIAMKMMGITVNMISMFGLVVVLGMLVDDGIIVAENAYRYMEQGMPPREAAVKGTEEVMGAVTAAVLTTIASFSPLLFMSGIIGKFIKNIPMVIIVALVASLAEAFIILPSHLADFVKIKLNKEGKPIKLAKDYKWFKTLIAFYTKVVTSAVKHKYRVVAGLILTLIMCIFIAGGVLKFVLFPSAGVNFLFVRMEAPIGTPLQKMNELVVPLEEIVAQLPSEELESYVTAIGKIEEDRHDPFSGKESHLAQITVYLTQEADRKRKVSEIIEDLRSKTKHIKGFTALRFDEPETGPPVGKAVEVKARGEDFEVLDKISQEYMEYLKTIDGTTDITWDHKPGKEEIRVVVDNNKAAMAGLSVGQIGKTVRAVFEGWIATTIKPVKAEEATDVTIKYLENKASDISVFDDILISNKFGKLIPLKKVARIEKVPGTTAISHLDGKRVVTTSCNVDVNKTTSMKVNQKLMNKFKDISDRYVGYTVKYGGEQEESMESLVSLARAFFYAFLIVYLILASFFKSIIQPFVVMFAIPFGLIGVIFAFLIHGLPFSFMAILGIVSLNGIVVNDSIVLVSFINKLRSEGIERRESIIKAGQMRIRPVLLTTITTVGGISTVAYGLGGKDPFLVPMALAICWGLVFATALTLIVIPCIYSIIDDIALKLTHHTSIIRCRKVGNGEEESEVLPEDGEN